MQISSLGVPQSGGACSLGASRPPAASSPPIAPDSVSLGGAQSLGGAWPRGGDIDPMGGAPEATIPTPPAALTPAQQAQADRARQGLADLIKVDPQSIALESFEKVTWSDSSLGFPMPGMGYATSLVDGVSVTFKAGGDRYAYHEGRGHGVYAKLPKEDSGWAEWAEMPSGLLVSRERPHSHIW